MTQYHITGCLARCGDETMERENIRLQRHRDCEFYPQPATTHANCMLTGKRVAAYAEQCSPRDRARALAARDHTGRACIDCGADIEDRPIGCTRCRPCAAEDLLHKNNRKKGKRT